MYFKKLIGENLYLSPINLEDCNKYTKWLNDMEVSIGLNAVIKLIDEDTEIISLERLKKSDYNFAIIDLK